MASINFTPLMKQYNDMKKKYPNTILLFRMGDFFETFDEDAAITAKICGITLTKRNNGAGAASPLAGFPHHQLDNYLPKLVKAGCRVAVCEQVEDPKKKSGPIVKREVIEVVTPGVSLYDKLLESDKNNFIVSLYFQENKKFGKYAGIAFCDISTGEFLVGEIPNSQIVSALESFTPAEIVYSKSQKKEIEELLSTTPLTLTHSKLDEWLFEEQFARELMMRQFQTKNFKGFGIDDLTTGIAAAGAVMHYISETQKQVIPQINSCRLFNPSDTMVLDFSTRRNLEILYNFEGGTHGSLIKLLDKTLTPLGARLLRKWLNQPLNKLKPIHQRLDAVELLFNNGVILENLNALLRGLGDIERQISRILSNKASTREVVSLATSLSQLPSLQQVLLHIENGNKDVFHTSLFSQIAQNISPLTELSQGVLSAMLDDPGVQFGAGHIFRPGYSSELDEYIQAKYSAKEWISKFQDEERYHTDISSLKVGFNNVFGYYIEITNAHKSKIPSHYERKQTLTNAERYTTPELKQFEQKIFDAEFQIVNIEKRLFDEIKMQFINYIEEIQANAIAIAELDCLQSFATCASQNNYVKPLVDDSLVIDIVAGRHPVVESILPVGEKYVPNSTLLDCDGEQIHVITGANMAGKSCYLRQNGLIVLMAQVGCFVPAMKARIGLVDRIFTRVGAQDNIRMGESTFLVEMQEAAYILHNATEHSLILLDEVGRGTATYDGISIAWAMTEYIHNKVKARTLFATHYHELNDLAAQNERITNYRADILESETEDKIVFTHRFVKGGSDHSFGIYVAKMAGLPKMIIDRAKNIVSDFEQLHITDSADKPKVRTMKFSLNKKIDEGQLSIFEFQDDALRDKLRAINMEETTPLQAFQILNDLIKEIM